MALVELRCCGCGKVFEGKDEIINGLYASCPDCGPWEPFSGRFGGTVMVNSTSELYNWRMRDDVCDECDKPREGVLFYKGPQEVEPALIYNPDGSLNNVSFPSPITKVCKECAGGKIALGWQPHRMEHGKLVLITQE